MQGGIWPPLSEVFCLLYAIRWWLNVKSLCVPCPSQGKGSKGQCLWARMSMTEQDRVGTSLYRAALTEQMYEASP